MVLMNWKALENFPLLIYILAAKTLILCLAFAGVKIYQRKRLEEKLKKNKWKSRKEKWRKRKTEVSKVNKLEKQSMDQLPDVAGGKQLSSAILSQGF